MLKLIVFTVAVRLLSLSSCSSLSTGAVSKRGNVQLCGRMLTETLHLLCQGQYYDPNENNVISRRDTSEQQMGASSFPSDFYTLWYLGLPSSRMNELGRNQYQNQFQYPASRRQERGVVDECCKKSCSPSVLLSYCRSG